MASVLHITVSAQHKKCPVAVLHLEGELDAQTQPELIDKAADLIANGATNILLDLSEVRFMGSAGVMAMHTIQRRLKETQSGDLKLLNPSDAVRRVLNVLQSRVFFDIYDNVDSALKAF